MSADFLNTPGSAVYGGAHPDERPSVATRSPRPQAASTTEAADVVAAPVVPSVVGLAADPAFWLVATIGAAILFAALGSGALL